MTPEEKLQAMSEPAKELLRERASAWAEYLGVNVKWATVVLLDRVQLAIVRPTLNRYGTGH